MTDDARHHAEAHQLPIQRQRAVLQPRHRCERNSGYQGRPEGECPRIDALRGCHAGQWNPQTRRRPVLMSTCRTELSFMARAFGCVPANVDFATVATSSHSRFCAAVSAFVEPDEGAA